MAAYDKRRSRNKTEMGEYRRALTCEEITAIRLALSAVLIALDKKSPMIDQASDTDVTDTLHACFEKERKTAEDLLDLLEDAEELVVHLPK